MNKLVWTLQILAAVAFAGAGTMKLVTAPSALRAKVQMGWSTEFSDGAIKAIGAAEVAGAVGLVAPAATPTDVVERLNKAFTEALRTPETRSRFAQLMAEPVPTTPGEFGAFMKKELARYEPVVKASGARVD